MSRECHFDVTLGQKRLKRGVSMKKDTQKSSLLSQKNTFSSKNFKSYSKNSENFSKKTVAYQNSKVEEQCL
jgi:hypothetical protein